MRTDEATFVDRLRSLAKLESPEVVREELEGVPTVDIAEALERLETEDGLSLLRQLDADVAADVLVDLSTESARRLIQELPDATVAHYLDVLPMDDALDLREELGDERFEGLLEIIPREDALEIRRLMSYPEGSAGQLMTESFFEVRPESLMTEILNDIRLAPEDKYETVNDIYVLNEDRHLIGVFSLRQAIRAKGDQTARDVMNSDIITCQAMTPAEDVARDIARYGFYAMPVLDDRGRMLGIFTVDDAQSVIQEADSEDVLKLAGVVGDADSYVALGTLQLVRRRLPWLLGLFVAETLTGQVLRYYGQSDGSLNLNPLTFFIPLLIGAGGNVGSQVTTTITRALALGEVRASDWLLILKRELASALIIGGSLGLLGFMRAFLPVVGWNSGMALSLVVGLALPAIVLWSASVGSLLPLAAKRMGIDPAVMSAPFISTFVDCTGLVIYFEIALHIMPRF